ncbi:hypothetical protein DCAR_0415892 [Daucus carota subsp. sativus]|uniref:Uncharacterized protein n=1 Tax=Daucus carota subsp. sativus TaxID=79200 RepID=A0A165WVF8_DAUCS|nr:hypothetical protein DCAR_0415892 [Daucus carota subsp. sativus]
MLVAITHTNIEARNVKLWKNNVVEQDPHQYDHMLPKGQVPPSGPSHGNNPPLERSYGLPNVLPSQHFHIHILPKGGHPPPGPSHGTTPDPPGPPPTL